MFIVSIYITKLNKMEFNISLTFCIALHKLEKEMSFIVFR